MTDHTHVFTAADQRCETCGLHVSAMQERCPGCGGTGYLTLGRPCLCGAWDHRNCTPEHACPECDRDFQLIRNTPDVIGAIVRGSK